MYLKNKKKKKKEEKKKEEEANKKKAVAATHAGTFLLCHNWQGNRKKRRCPPSVLTFRCHFSRRNSERHFKTTLLHRAETSLKTEGRKIKAKTKRKWLVTSFKVGSLIEKKGCAGVGTFASVFFCIAIMPESNRKPGSCTLQHASSRADMSDFWHLFTRGGSARWLYISNQLFFAQDSIVFL